MRQRTIATAGALILIFLLTACGGGSGVRGTWYGERHSGDILTLEKDGTYTAEFPLSGKYTFKDDLVTLNTIFGDTARLALQKQGGETVLMGEDGYAYYRTAAAAEAARETRRAAEEAAREAARIAEEEAAEAARIAAELEAAAAEAAAVEALKGGIVGFWLPGSGESFPLEFSADGSYLYYENGEALQGEYAVLDSATLSLTAADGSVREVAAHLTDGGLQLSVFSYLSGPRLDVTDALLLGKWNDIGVFPIAFQSDGTMTRDLGYKVDTYTYRILDGSTIALTDKNGNEAVELIFLVETQAGYRLSMGSTALGKKIMSGYNKVA